MEDRGRSRRRPQVRTAFDDRSREMSKERPRKKPSSNSAKARKKQRRRQVNTALSIVAVLAAGYFAVSLKYREEFLPNTSIGGISVAGMTVDKVKEKRKVYREPEIFKDNPTLLEQKKQWERYAKVKVTYRFGSRSEVVDGTTILSWLAEGGDKNVTIDRTKVEEYVKGLAKTYNTAYHTKVLKTSYGSTVKITQGNYGWMIDQKTEVEQLIQAIESGESQEREPVYLQTAASHDGPDYGDTYVEMNLTAQHLFYYKNGKLLIESDFVSGDEAKGWSTPAGAYELTYKQKDATLKGKNYKTPVTYWMPFNGNIGMHDGYWRSSFGGTIYKKNGSHGCVNLPPAVAKIIFENIEKGIPVLCYHLEGTQTNKTTKDSSGKTGTSGKEKETAAIPEPSSAAETSQTGELGPAGETAPVPESPAGTADAPNSNISMEGPGVAAPVPVPVSAPGTEQ